MLETQISYGRLAQFCHRVGTSVRAGIDPRRIWSLETGHGTSIQRQKMEEIGRRIAAGDTVSEAMRDARGYFPSLVCELVEVGEQTGRLDEVLLGLAHHYDHLVALRREFIRGVTPAALQFTAAVLIVGGLIWFMGIISPDTQILPGLSGGSAVVTYFLLIATALGAITAMVFATVRGWFGPVPMMLAMRVPMLGGCIKDMALSRFCWTLGMTLDSGVDARRSVKLALRSTQNTYYMSHEETVDRAILKGVLFVEALGPTGAFPEDFLHSLRVAEESGTHGDSMFRLAQEYQGRAERASRLLSQLATFAVWGCFVVLMCLLIYRLVVTLILPPYQEAFDFLDESQRR